MSTFAENNLRKGEEILLKGKVNPLCAFSQILWCLVVLAAAIAVSIIMGGNENLKDMSLVITLIVWIAFIVIGVLPLLYRIIYLCSMSLAVTNKRVIGKVGIIKKNTLDYPIEKVDNISTENSFWGAILKYHTVTVLGGGGSDAKIKFQGISNAVQFKNTVTDAIEQHAEEARKAQAAEIAAAMAAAAQSKNS